MTVVRQIPEQVVRGKRLGRHLEHDPASRNFGVARTGPLRSVLWRRHVDIYNQGETGSCTGNAIAGAVSTAPFTHHLHETAARRLYHLATSLDDIPGTWPPDDTGSSGLAACKAAQQKLLIHSYAHAFSLDEALQALMSGPVITGTDWLTGMDEPDSNGLVHATGDVRGGHEYCVLGVDVDAKTVRFANSWGSDWGDKGFAVMSFDDWALLLSRDGDVTVPQR